MAISLSILDTGVKLLNWPKGAIVILDSVLVNFQHLLKCETIIMSYILVRSKMNLSNEEELFKGTTTYIDFDQEIAQDRSALYRLIKTNLSDLKPESSFGQEGPCTCWTNKPPYQVLNILELRVLPGFDRVKKGNNIFFDQIEFGDFI